MLLPLGASRYRRSRTYSGFLDAALDIELIVRVRIEARWRQLVVRVNIFRQHMDVLVMFASRLEDRMTIMLHIRSFMGLQKFTNHLSN